MKSYTFPLLIETIRALILHLVKMMLDEPNRTSCITLGGRSTLALVFDLWANEHTDITPWERLKVLWVDERYVSPENSDSNYGAMRSLLLSIIPIPYENVFRTQGENNPKKKVARYSKLVMKEVPVKNGFPVFDVVLLGAGNNGYTSFIFPGQEELLLTDYIYKANFNLNNGQKRIALIGMPILNACRIIFLITGGVKGSVVEDIFYSGDMDPAAHIAHHADNVEPFMDNAVAEKIIRR